MLLLTPPSSNASLIEYRLIGGTLDFYFFSGPTPQQVIQQYGELVGLPTWQPAFGFGFHLCRWGYKDLNDTRDQVSRMREANIPLEGKAMGPDSSSDIILTGLIVMWNDIDLYHDLRDFTSDPVRFPPDAMRSFIQTLVRQHAKPEMRW